MYGYGLVEAEIELKTRFGHMSEGRMSMQTEWEFYQWSETKINNEHLSLRECVERYGVGGWYSNDKDMVAALIFLDTDRSPDNSWLLGLKHLDGEQAPARVYDDHLYTYKLSLNTSLGAHITSLLAGCVFEQV